MRRTDIPTQFAELIDDCRSLIASSGVMAGQALPAAAEPLPSLLEQCREVTQRAESDAEPIRTIHHFACTGGTLIAKCLASLPNTSVLSEVEPHSRLPLRGDSRFFPTDLIQLLRVGTYPSNEDLESQVFLSGLKVVYEDSVRRGLRLVLRDHAHSKYCVGSAVSEASSLRQALADHLRMLSIVTVRHPLDSYLSLANNEWLDFQPPDLGEYCARYLRFLDDYSDCPVFRYEEFVSDPRTEAKKICDVLALPFADAFEDVFWVHRLSGDSGRRSRKIGPRDRREVPAVVAEQALDASPYVELCGRLAYDPGPSSSVA